MNSFKDKEILNLLEYKYQVKRWKLAVPWGIINSIVAITLYYDLQNGSISTFLMSISPLLWYFECTLLVIFSVNVMFDLGNYFWISFGSTQWKLSPQLRTLLGIEPSDKFCTDFGPANNSKADLSKMNTSLGPGDASDLSNFFVSSTQDQSSRLWTSSPSSSIVSSSPFGTSFSDNSRMLSTSASSWSYVDGNDASARIKQSLLFNNSFPMNAEEIVTDKSAIKKYLTEMEKTESQIIGAADLSNTSACSSGRWSANATFGSDISPIVNKFQYQLSTRGPQSNTQRLKDEDSSSCSQEEVWSRVGVQSDALFGWTENLRKWLGKTILSRLVSEIDKVNESLRWQGMTDVQIGEVGLGVLRQRAKGPQFTSLYAVLQYLEVTPNQEYLVHRLKELEKGGCMSEFRWNSGGSFKGKPWGDHLPTDSAIVCSLFCVYLDSRLPLHSGFPDGKPFTNQFFCKTPDQPNLSHKEGLSIYQSSINPPHFKLLVGSEVWELQKGRNNLFHVILLFLYLLKTKENGMLNRINLGPSGLNILWIID